MAKITSYVTHPQSVCAEDGSKLSGVLNVSYDSAEFASGVVNDYDVKASESDAFSNVTLAKFCSIRTDATITIKFNSASNPSITIDANSSLNVDTLEITNIFITAAANANVKIFLT